MKFHSKSYRISPKKTQHFPSIFCKKLFVWKLIRHLKSNFFQKKTTVVNFFCIIISFYLVLLNSNLFSFFLHFRSSSLEHVNFSIWRIFPENFLSIPWSAMIMKILGGRPLTGQRRVPWDCHDLLGLSWCHDHRRTAMESQYELTWDCILCTDFKSTWHLREIL